MLVAGGQPTNQANDSRDTKDEKLFYFPKSVNVFLPATSNQQPATNTCFSGLSGLCPFQRLIVMNENRILTQLNDFNPAVRRSALETLASSARAETEHRSPCRGWTNMHCHTFFSYNARGYSPCRFAWEARGAGLEAAGIVDFDCLDGTEEFLAAGRLLELKTCAGLETRVFVPEYGEMVINSPGEPGVFYISGVGFVAPPAPGSSPAGILDSMRLRARKRNMAMMERINRHLAEVEIDYEADVLSRTPAGNATERHMLGACEEKARGHFADPRRLSAFWAEKLAEPEEEIARIIDAPSHLQTLIRKKLMKQGGPGYAMPAPDTFPDIGEVVGMIRRCGAIPSACWLDGASAGEENPQRHLEFLLERGCESVSVIPDRNWNVPQEERDWKVRNLNELLRAGNNLDMIILAGTEMNSDGNRLVDDFDSPALAPHRETFRKGALTLWGHTLLLGCIGSGLIGEWSAAHFGSDRRARNAFFASAGEKPYPSAKAWEAIQEMGAEAAPDDLLDVLSH